MKARSAPAGIDLPKRGGVRWRVDCLALPGHLCAYVHCGLKKKGERLEPFMMKLGDEGGRDEMAITTRESGRTMDQCVPAILGDNLLTHQCLCLTT